MRAILEAGGAGLSSGVKALAAMGISMAAGILFWGQGAQAQAVSPDLKQIEEERHQAQRLADAMVEERRATQLAELVAQEKREALKLAGLKLPLDRWQVFPQAPLEKEGPLEFLRKRVKVGVGFDEEYNLNVLLEDNKKQKEFISTLEGQVVFLDPRGSLEYGGSYEVNAFRHHRRNRNAINHEARGLVKFDPGGLYSLEANYLLDVKNSFIFSSLTEENKIVDILRRSADFQRRVTHGWDSRLLYNFNPTTRLTSKASYELFDDQIAQDAGTDRKTLKAGASLERELNPKMTLKGEYLFTDVVLPSSKLSSSKTHTATLGLGLSVTDFLDLDLALSHNEATPRETNKTAITQAFTGGFDLKFEKEAQRLVGRRTTIGFKYSDTRDASYQGEKVIRVRNTKPSFEVNHELTRLVSLSLKGFYLKSKPEIIVGGATRPKVERSYNLNFEIKWQLLKDADLLLNYRHSRSKSSDATGQVISVGFETLL